MQNLQTQCCIVGGGPAGMMLGLLLAGAGVDVIVLEKHKDFLRDFRGDTIHPSTLELMFELGLLEEFLKRPHQKVTELAIQMGDELVPVADFSHLATQCKFVAFIPQWDFLDFIADAARQCPTFHLLMQTEVTGLISENDKICGVRARQAEEVVEIRAALTIGADGRHSIVRKLAGLAVTDLGAPMDVLWLRLSRRPDDPSASMGRIEAGRMFVMINRSAYWQCAYVIAKGSIEDIHGKGLPAFRSELAKLQPFLADRLGELQSWDDVKLLTVTVDRLETWHRPGLLCIGDAAHAMSPIGGVGINLAIQDAVATANLLAVPLLSNQVAERDLAKVQRRRMLPTRVIQRLQTAVQSRVIGNVLAASGPTIDVPWPVKLFKRWPWLRRIPAWLIGVGIRPEHVRTLRAPFTKP